MIPPRSSTGSLHVAVNSQSRCIPGHGAADSRPAEDDPARRHAGETLEAYVDRRLAIAQTLVLPNRSRAYAVAKRTIDLALGTLLLVVALPVILILAAIMRIDSPGARAVPPGPGHPRWPDFRFYKFRTMYVDAKDRFPDLYAYQFTDSNFDDAVLQARRRPAEHPVRAVAAPHDARRAAQPVQRPQGRPQPRRSPARAARAVRYYRPEELACLFTKAGLTGLAQVAGRSLLTVRERLTLDLRYVSHQTLLLDLRILWRTLIVVVAGKGAF